MLDESALYADTVTNRLVNRVVTSRPETLAYYNAWSVLLVRHDHHLYSKMTVPVRTLFSREQLRKLHRQFAHPAAEKLYKLLRIAQPEQTSPETLKVLQDLTSCLEPCSKINNVPYRLCVPMGTENVRFNRRVNMDIMYLEGKPVRHLVDEATIQRSDWARWCRTFGTSIRRLPVNKFIL